MAYPTAVVTNSRVYLLGGAGDAWASIDTVYTAPINSDGTLGTWTTSTSLPGVLNNSSAVVTTSRVYLLGGSTSTSVSTVYTAQINLDGSLGPWTTGTSLPGVLHSSSAVVTNSRVYLLGGYNGSSSVSTVYTAPFLGGSNDYSTASYTTLVPSDDPHWDNVVLALPFDGTDGSTTITDISATPKTVTAVGNAHIENTQSKFGVTSCYFDGNGDYLSIPYSSDIDMGSGDFTVECWFRPTNDPDANGNGIVICGTSIGNRPWGVYQGTATRIVGWFQNTSGTYTTGASNTTGSMANKWSHVALARSGDNLLIFVDGVLGDTIAISGAAQSFTNLRIGRFDWNPAGDMLGYIDDLRITKGVARYTADFTPPTKSFQYNDLVTPKKLAIEDVASGEQLFVEIERWDSIERSAQLWTKVPIVSSTDNTVLKLYYDSTHVDNNQNEDPYWSNVVLALPFDGADGSTTITDISPTPKSITGYGNTHIESDQSVFGGTSGYFDGSGDYLTIGSASDTATQLGTSDFTIEFWCLVKFGTPNYMEVLSKGSAGHLNVDDFEIFIRKSGGTGCFRFAGTTANDLNFPGNDGSQWRHYAVSRQGTTWRSFYDGILQTERTGLSVNINDTNYPLMVGFRGAGTSDNYYYGYIDDLIITKGTGRYTENFTPPTRSISEIVSGHVDDIGSYPSKRVWENNYEAVYHLSQDPSTTVKDSTFNGRNLTSYGSMTTYLSQIDGVIGKALKLDGVDDYLQSTNSNLSTLQTEFTLECVGVISSATAWTNLCEIGNRTVGSIYLAEYDTSGYLNSGLGSDDLQSNVVIDPSNFKSYGLVLSSGAVRSVGNGIIDSVSNMVTVEDLSSAPVSIQYLGYYSANSIQSIKISKIARSATWLEASYNSDFDQLLNINRYEITVMNPYPIGYSKVYGFNQALQLMVTVSGLEGTNYYDTTFYNVDDVAIFPTISGTPVGTEVSTSLATYSGVDYFWYADVSLNDLGLSYTTPLYSFYVRYLCSGIVNDPVNTASGVVLNLHRRSTGELAGTTIAGTGGTFSIDTMFNEEHYIAALHPRADFNAQIFDKIEP
jgi:hypothetical protein